jgi:hypothetical protein
MLTPCVRVAPDGTVVNAAFSALGERARHARAR